MRTAARVYCPSAWKVCSRTLDGAEACRYTHGVVHGLRISASLREMRRARCKNRAFGR
jgi:hypothetical protein